MKIGLIEKTPAHTKTTYWFMGLSKCKEITSIKINTEIKDRYSFFPLKNNNIEITSIEDIEKDTSLDFILYGWEYIRRNGIPNTTVPCGVIFGGAKRWSFGGKGKEVIDKCDKVFKIACPIDLDIFKSLEGKPEKFRSKAHLLSQEQVNKINPLMFIGSWNVDYPIEIQHFNNLLSFYGSPTSLNRIKTILLLKKKYKKKFIGGFTNNKLASCDEFGNDLTKDQKLIKEHLVKGIRRDEYLNLMKQTMINICPSGLGNSTHRFVDILCMGSFCLTTTLKGLDYGKHAPIVGEHYIEYSEDCSDLIDIIEYYKNNEKEVFKICDAAYIHMQRTYRKSDLMAREYIINKFIGN